MSKCAFILVSVIAMLCCDRDVSASCLPKLKRYACSTTSTQQNVMMQSQRGRPTLISRCKNAEGGAAPTINAKSYQAAPPSSILMKHILDNQSPDFPSPDKINFKIQMDIRC